MAEKSCDGLPICILLLARGPPQIGDSVIARVRVTDLQG
jgi:hypothetical protein